MDYVLTSTGTDRGSGFQSNWLNCPRRAALDYIDSKTREKKPEKERNPEEAGKPHKLVVGSLFHLFLRLYYGGTPFRSLDDRIVWEDGSLVSATHPASYRESARLYAEYQLQSSPDDMGTPIGFETQLKVRITDGDSYRDVTGAVDRETQIEEVHRADALKRYGLDLEPGLYLVDDKTESKTTDFDMKFRMSLQFSQYMLIKEMELGTPVKGLLVNVFVKTKSPQRHVLLVPGLSQDERRMVLEMLAQVPTQKTLDELVSGVIAPEAFRANPTQCVSSWDNESCYWYRSGKCKRY